MLPFLELISVAKDRFHAIDRSLPVAIDLASLCMGAGLDFPSTLREIASRLPSNDAILQEELGYIMKELELGYTRQHALENFARRVPTQAVLGFTSNVIQAEMKGTSLVEILTIQATTMRTQRMLATEEKIGKISSSMIWPLFIMFVAIFLLVTGPFFAKVFTSPI